MADPGSNVRDTAQAVQGIVEAVPVYQDAVQPAAQELGKGLETVAKTINVCLAPLKAIIWGAGQFEDFLRKNVAEKLSETPTEEIIEPKPHVAGPALEALRFTGYEESLRDLYANLLAASMDSKTVSLAHPSFVEIIKQMTPDEARLMKYFSTEELLPLIRSHLINTRLVSKAYFRKVRIAPETRKCAVWVTTRAVLSKLFPIYEIASSVRAELVEGSGGRDIAPNLSLFGKDANCEHEHLTPSYIDNLSRLGLISTPDKFYTAAEVYEELENYPSVLELKNQIDSEEGQRASIDRGLVQITHLGRQFIKACVIDHRELQQPGSQANPLPG